MFVSKQQRYEIILFIRDVYFCKKPYLCRLMLEKHPKYRLGRLFVLLIVPLVFFEGCRLLSLFKPEVESAEEACEEEVAVDMEELNHYYDSIRMMESQRFHDSCEWVLQAEWDSVLRTLPPSVSFAELLADSIIEYARTFMGVPYKHGGNGPKKFDCSGYTIYVFKHFGYSLKRTVIGQLHDGWKEIDDTADLRRGDLVFFGGRKNPNKMGHVAIVVDNNPEDHYFTFIHATVKLGVTVSRSDEKYYRIRYMTACRILPES